MGRQIPRNASISLTLSNAHTDTTIDYRVKQESGLTMDFLFEGQRNQSFADKLVQYLRSVSAYHPIVDHLHLAISSSNSFPHSSGIASSASAMAAVAMCICDIESQVSGESAIDIAKASYLARLGSGSASRSVIPQAAVWGRHDSIDGSSDLFAVPFEGMDPVFAGYHDDILIVSASEKSVSSTAGHALMEGNVYAGPRYQQANDRVASLTDILRAGDIEAFGKLAEDEAMTLHALMMCSDPSYVLMEPGTLDMIREIRAYRADSNVPVYFTLDAGPNIHLLYPDAYAGEVKAFINDQLLQYTADNKVIKDHVGNGPEKTS